MCNAATISSSVASAAAGAPSSTITYSPRGAISATWTAAPASVPRHTSSCSLVSSRASATCRSPPHASARSVDRADHSVRRFVEHDGPALGGDLRDALGSLATAARQESFEHEATGVEAADHQRHHQRRRTRHSGDRMSRRRSPRRTRRMPGVADAGRARVGDDRHVARRRRAGRAPRRCGRASVCSLATANRTPLTPAWDSNFPLCRVSSQQISAHAFNASTARGGRSPRLPIGVLTSTSRPVTRATPPRRRRGAPTVRTTPACASTTRVAWRT